MKCLEKLSIKKESFIGYNSFILVVKSKYLNLYKVCTDFLVLNDKLVKINHTFPLLQNYIKTVSQSHFKVRNV